MLPKSNIELHESNKTDPLAIESIEVNHEMPKSEGFDDIFGDQGDKDLVKWFISEQRRVHRELMQQIKRLQDAVKNGKLNGKTEFRPFKKPGLSGFIFRGTYETPEMTEENKLSESTEDGIENKGSFALPEAPEADDRRPIAETFTEGNDFVAVVELPGVDESEIRIETGDTWLRVGAINFKTTTINVPSNVDSSKIHKKYKNGILEIRMPLKNNISDQENMKYRIV